MKKTTTKIRKQSHGKPGSKSLNIIRQYFPKVSEIVDAKARAIIEVTKEDAKSSGIKDPLMCAFAKASYRAFDADGVIIALTTSYVIMKKRAIRFKNSETLSREIISFDRRGGFDPGLYLMSPFSPRQQLGVYKGRPTHVKSKGGADRRQFRHFTRDVRVLSSTEEVKS